MLFRLQTVKIDLHSYKHTTENSCEYTSLEECIFDNLIHKVVDVSIDPENNYCIKKHIQYSLTDKNFTSVEDDILYRGIKYDQSDNPIDYIYTHMYPAIYFPHGSTVSCIDWYKLNKTTLKYDFLVTVSVSTEPRLEDDLTLDEIIRLTKNK